MSLGAPRVVAPGAGLRQPTSLGVGGGACGRTGRVARGHSSGQVQHRCVGLLDHEARQLLDCQCLKDGQGWVCGFYPEWQR